MCLSASPGGWFPFSGMVIILGESLIHCDMGLLVVKVFTCLSWCSSSKIHDRISITFTCTLRLLSRWRLSRAKPPTPAHLHGLEPSLMLLPACFLLRPVKISAVKNCLLFVLSFNSHPLAASSAPHPPHPSLNALIKSFLSLPVSDALSRLLSSFLAHLCSNEKNPARALWN